MTAKETALLYGLILVVAVLIRRRQVVSLTTTGVFFASHIVLVVVGVLSAPWLIDTPLLRLSFPFHWEALTDRDLSRAILVVCRGLLTVLGGHAVVDWLHRAAGARPLPRFQMATEAVANEGSLSPWRLAALALGATAIASAFMSTKVGVVLDGFRNGYLGGDIPTQYNARFQMQALGRGFYLIVFNAIPFLAILAWLRYRVAPSRKRFFAGVAMVIIAALLLLTTFEKRPLVLFVLTLLLTHTLTEIQRRRAAPAPGTSVHRHQVPWGLVAGLITIPLALLGGLYLLSTTVAQKYGFGSEGAQALMLILLLRIFGRLSAMPLFYVHYFPTIHDFYGFSNIGLFSTIAGTPPYRDTIDVFTYFSGSNVGTGAIGAITDFYSAFGWPGLLLGCFVLGVMLYALDRWLASLAPSLVNRTLSLMMLVFISSLSQASLARSLSTYGGIIFLVLWATLALRLLPARVSNETLAT